MTCYQTIDVSCLISRTIKTNHCILPTGSMYINLLENKIQWGSPKKPACHLIGFPYRWKVFIATRRHNVPSCRSSIYRYPRTADYCQEANELLPLRRQNQVDAKPEDGPMFLCTLCLGKLNQTHKCSIVFVSIYVLKSRSHNVVKDNLMTIYTYIYIYISQYMCTDNRFTAKNAFREH